MTFIHDLNRDGPEGWYNDETGEWDKTEPTMASFVKLDEHGHVIHQYTDKPCDCRVTTSGLRGLHHTTDCAIFVQPEAPVT